MHLKTKKDYLSEIENINYCPTKQIFCSFVVSERGRNNLQKREEITLDYYEVKKFLDRLGYEIYQAPKNAVFEVGEDGRVHTFSLAENGKKLDVQSNLKKISDFLKSDEHVIGRSEINMDFINIEPGVRSSDAEKLGLVSLIGEGHSDFTGSSLNRIHNIEVATSRFHGLLIKPGEEFSFIENLGPVDGAHGFRQELVIKNNSTESEFGGGTCQVSTTIFRAAVYSGLKITDRKNHAYPVHYYAPQGMDATVYVPRPDLRFINNTSNNILIQSNVDLEKKKMNFKIYGTDDGRKVEVDGPHILLRRADGSMNTVFTQRVYNIKNELIIEDIFNSFYDSPNKYPHPGQDKVLTRKPDDWSDNEWKRYKKEHGL